MTAGPSILALLVAAINAQADVAVPEGGTLGGATAESRHEIGAGEQTIEVRGHRLADFEGLIVRGADGREIGRVDEFLGDDRDRIVGLVLETRLIDPAREVELVLPLDRLRLAGPGEAQALDSSLTPADLKTLGRWPD
ncbi:PRC-barrel domain-containing protein [Caenispirillum bisanense]|uniref:PRC-barrel domain-containing protein n=1 Tax=Caenispirillum bisanense TaxID=414052 RepID=A0A286GU14_9PROT|nr:PRC-barrel domain-containing protein [Caenispirillum bisanense]SOD99000.1 hypothetical protein SAMN05421508_108181 [Caenispirillum bisanense]